MRRRRARLLAIATGLAVVALAATFAALRARPGAAPSAATPAPGHAVYKRLGCPACHSLGGEGNPRLPLDDVGRRLSRDAIRTWIVAPQQMDPDVRKPAYDRVPKADVEAVVELLAVSP